MTLLMPELERQLRAVVRAELPASRPPRQRRSWFVLTAGTVVALGVAALAIALLGAGRAPQRAIVPRPATHRPGCAVALPDRGPAGPVLGGGTLAGQRWTLRRGPRRPVLDLGGHRYGFRCAATLDFGLIATGEHGIVFGFAALPHVSRVVAAIDALSARPPRTVDAQVRVASRAGTFYLIVLPRPACTVRSLWIDAMYPGRPTAMIVGGDAAVASTLLNRPENTAAPLAYEYTTCPAQGLVPPTPVAPAKSLPAPPPGLTPSAAAAFRAGERAYNQAGCAACHALAGTGNNGPGLDLTHLGARLTPPAIASALIHPTPPMPSFTHMPAAQRQALIAFLSALK